MDQGLFSGLAYGCPRRLFQEAERKGTAEFLKIIGFFRRQHLARREVARSRIGGKMEGRNHAAAGTPRAPLAIERPRKAAREAELRGVLASLTAAKAMFRHGQCPNVVEMVKCDRDGGVW